ncbi:MAG TPA: hypothetical protein VM889_14245 [Candidatus Thermoplasmatota archaeon]|nr:hypothetical protein [Candidatus Thermoplasmatota archaeon]
MESIVWRMDWNPEFEDEPRLKREILKALQDDKTIETIKRFAETAHKEALEDGLETEHLLWLDSSFTYAFFVRVWYEVSEKKLFIIVEENDLGDVGFLILEDLDCASYNEENTLKVEFREPDDLGVSL